MTEIASNETISPAAKRLLIVGGGGFIGGFIAAEGLRRGFETWVTVRRSTSRRWLGDERLHLIELDYDAGEEPMAEALSRAMGGVAPDCIIYNLGATKCTNFADFNRINYGYLRSFIGALRLSGLMPRRFLYMSSLSALGPGDEKTYEPLTSRTIPHPDTRYGTSKIKAETLLEASADVPWTIFRPTGVYGPHEQDYLMMIRSIDSHFDFGVGFRRQLLTFIYVDDLVDAMFDALATDRTLRRKYIIAEGRAYTQGDFRRIVARALRRRAVVPVRLPLWMVYAASVVAEKIGVARMKPSTLNRDKFRIMRQRNWDCDISDAQRDFGFTPRVTLEEGVRRTVEAYLEAKKRKKEEGRR